MRCPKVSSFFRFLVIFGVFTRIEYGRGQPVGNHSFRKAVTLDPEGKYQLEWIVDEPAKRITFNVAVETTGYLSLGLSGDEKSRSGVDVVVGGVKSNGETYFSDRHGIGGWVPVIDSRQDWKLISARETPTHTYLSFSRPLETGDPEDYPITNKKLFVVWSYGDRDTQVSYIYTNKRGAVEMNLLDPN